ncbi:hypothetical protein DFQ26_000789, partial [Actinomortierella ambigua]
MTERCSYCNVVIETSTVRLVDAPGLLEASDENTARNARAITEAFHSDGGFKLIFVLAGCSGRVQPADLFTIGKVMSAIDFSINVGVIINRVPDQEVMFYHDTTVRNSIVEKLNSCADNRIMDGWFTVIPQFSEDNPAGPMPYITALLTTMTPQEIPRVTPINMAAKEFNHFVDFVNRIEEWAYNVWRHFQDWFLILASL